MSTTGINSNYGQFYKGTTYGSGNSKPVVKYEFNTTDEKGNKIMDKMSKEETFRTMNEIATQYGDDVIVEFSGDGLTAFEKNKGKLYIPEVHRELPENIVTELEGPTHLTEEQLKSVPGARTGKEILANMQEVDPKAYKEYQALSEKSKKEGFDPYNNEVIYMARWQMKRDFPQLSAWNNIDSNSKEPVVKNDHIMTDYKYEFASRMPSVYVGKDDKGDYLRNYYSTSDAASNMLKVYASLYDEIIKGYEAGTRETYVADKNAESGCRKLTMEEELAELDKAYEDYVDKYAANRDKHVNAVINILSAYEKLIEKISDGRASVPNEVSKLLDKYKNDPVPDNFSDIMKDAAKSFIMQYKDNKDMDLKAVDWNDIIKKSNKDKTTTDTNDVDREIEKLKEKKKQLEQEMKTADESKKEDLEAQIQQLEMELLQKDNDTYRRNNAVIS